ERRGAALERLGGQHPYPRHHRLTASGSARCRPGRHAAVCCTEYDADGEARPTLAAISAAALAKGVRPRPAGGTGMSEQIERLCGELSLAAVANQYANLADEAAKKKRSFVEYLEAVLRAEAALRDERRREVLRRMAGFPAVKTLEQFDFEAAAGVPKARIQELAGLAFIERRENIIFLGPSGTGKSHLA